MSETDNRTVPSRGRSSTRGRGGFARGGPRGLRKQANGTSSDKHAIEESLDDQGEIGEMKKKYILELTLLRDMFPDWTDTDLVFALEEADGDVPSTVDKITQGAVSQFAEVKKPKDRARSKVKEEAAFAPAAEKVGSAARGGRGRGGADSTRGGRGRGSDRGRGGHRGGRGGHATTNGTSKDGDVTSVPTTESNAWDTPAIPEAAEGNVIDPDAVKKTADGGATPWGNVVASDTTPAAASEGAKPTLIPEGGPKKSWASMFAQPKPAPVAVPAVPKPAPTKEPPPAELAASAIPAVPVESASQIKEPESVPLVIANDQPEVLVQTELPVPAATSLEEEATLAPTRAPLTEENVEHLPDESIPPATQTVASTVDSADLRNHTPLPSQVSIGKSPLGGFATSASSRLAGVAGRSASYNRRVQEQQEAVVMPGHNAVDRAAVQFGSMGLGGDSGLDVDDDREDPETRQQPQHSPPSQPRTSLPPVPRQSSAQQEQPATTDTFANPKQAPGLPPASAQNQQQIQDSSLAQPLPPDASLSQMYNQYNYYNNSNNRNNQPGLQQDSGAQQQKPYETFGHQAQPSGYDQYGAHTPQPIHQGQSGFGGLSSAPSDYSNYYTSDQSRYNYYGTASYNQQDLRSTPAQHDPAIGQQRTGAGFGTGPNEASHATQAGQQSRFGDSTNSGANTPNPLANAQPHSTPGTQQAPQSLHQGQGHQQPGAFASGASAAFPYGHPYYNSPYQTAYQNQFGYTGHQLGYGGGYPQNKGGMYGAPHGYGMGSGASYDQHSSSPANVGAFSQNPQAMRSSSGVGTSLGGLDDYGRASTHSSQQQQQQPPPQQQPQHNQGTGFGGMSDSFTRSTSGLGTQYGQQAAPAGQDDTLKAYNDSTKNGPSPSLAQPGRPGSAANSVAGSQSGLPPTQTHQSGFGGGYPGYPGQGSQYGGLGGLGGHQQSQSGMGGGQTGYSGYSAGGFNQTYGNYGASRGGWGQNYNQH